MTRSIHDNVLVSYEVLCGRREIRFRTEFRDRGEPSVFTDVIAYRLSLDCFTNIIFDIDRTPPESIYRNHRAEFESGIRYGWPGEWAKTEEAALAYFRQHAVNGYILQASCGMEGWILAEKMEKISIDEQIR